MDCDKSIYTARCKDKSRKCDSCSCDDNLQPFPAAASVTESTELEMDGEVYVIVPAAYLEALERSHDAMALYLATNADVSLNDFVQLLDNAA